MSTQGAGPKGDPRLQSGVPVQAVGQTAGLYATKPKPIITGESQAQGIAMFSYRASYEDLTPERRERLKVSVLDSLACAINALGAAPTVACVEQAKQFGGSDAQCTLIGGGNANVIYAASANTALVRYVDLMDSYLGPVSLCHPSDNVGAVLAACEHAGRSGKEFLTALAVAYQVESELTSVAPFMEEGFDLTTPLSFSIGAGASKALQLDEAKTAAAVEICGDVIPLLVVRTTPISQWKGLNSSQTALSSMHGVFLASRGVTGPKYVIEGTSGLAHALGKSIEIESPGLLAPINVVISSKCCTGWPSTLTISSSMRKSAAIAALPSTTFPMVQAMEAEGGPTPSMPPLRRSIFVLGKACVNAAAFCSEVPVPNKSTVP